jgi:hypothetical protein
MGRPAMIASLYTDVGPRLGLHAGVAAVTGTLVYWLAIIDCSSCPEVVERPGVMAPDV